MSSLPTPAAPPDPQPTPAPEPTAGREPLPPAPLFSPLAGVLSYLVPGLGQISQGRVGKGLLFLVCVYALFGYGMWLGTKTVNYRGREYRIVGSVYLPRTGEAGPPAGIREALLRDLPGDLYARPQFAGQFFVGVAAWPAIAQYLAFDRNEASRVETSLDALYPQLEEAERDRNPVEAARVRDEIKKAEESEHYRHPRFGDLMREPSEVTVNVITNAGDKRLELSWVYTVIAGVLNIMVIYDAVAGPAFLAARRPEDEEGAAK